MDFDYATLIQSAYASNRLISQGAPGSHVNLIPLNPTKGRSSLME